MRLPWQKSDLHPHALSLDEDALDGADFADALTADLAAMDPPDIIHRFRVVAEAGQQDAALVANGFSVTRLTHIINLPLDTLDHPALSDKLPDTLNPHWFTKKDRAPWGAWIDAHWRHYCATHASNPPRPPPRGLRQIFVGKDLVEAFALRKGPQGRVRGFGSLRADQELGWIGGPADCLPHVLAACLRRATTLGWAKATLEVDDDDRALWALVDVLDVTPAQTFVTWQRERGAANRPN